jgi:beta-glucosidase
MAMIVLALLLALAYAVRDEAHDFVDLPWMNPEASPSERAHTLLAKMTLDEKLAMVHGYGGAYVGNIPANTRLGIPALKLEDGKLSPFWQTSVRFSALQCASVYAQYIFL